MKFEIPCVKFEFPCAGATDSFIKINYITLPFMRIMPHKKGISPFDEKAWPNEPSGFVTIPVVVTSDMNDEDVMRAALLDRDRLIDKWLELGNCSK